MFKCSAEIMSSQHTVAEQSSRSLIGLAVIISSCCRRYYAQLSGLSGNQSPLNIAGERESLMRCFAINAINVIRMTSTELNIHV